MSHGNLRQLGPGTKVVECPGLSHGNLGQLGPGTKVVGCPRLSRGNLGQLGPGTSRVVLGRGMSRDVPGCPMATWDNLDLGLAGW